jgi:NAD(P)-dependent dehydrogenase (short-subunit alcohol dehydrogenase family)
VVGVVTDVTSLESVEALRDATLDAFGAVHLVCNNAGIGSGSEGQIWEHHVNDWRWSLDVNVMGVVNGINAFVPTLLAQDTEGHIVNTASVSGIFGSPLSGPYNISKFAAFAATETLAGDLVLSGSKLRASVLCPGIVSTNIATRALHRPEETGRPLTDDQRFVTDMLIDLVPTGLDPAEVAGIVLDGVRAEDFLILTHGHHAGSITSRAAELTTRALPSVVAYT